MKFESTYFDNLEEAIAVGQQLVDEDNEFANDRQIVANFYNGRDTMSKGEAEKNNTANVVNHLFGYNAIDRLRSQITSLFTSGDTVWKIEADHPQLNVTQNQQFGAIMTAALTRRINRSRRIRPEWRAQAGNLVLHGRNVMMFRDRFDWCPRSAHLYVPSDARPNRESLPYAFSAEKISIDKLKGYLRTAKASGSSGAWNIAALQEAVDSMNPGHPSNPIVDRAVNEEKVAEHDNNSSREPTDGTINTRSSLPVWYLYEVDHNKQDKPVSLKIIARYSILQKATPNGGTTEMQPRELLLYHNKKEFDSVCHWICPFFIDTEIGGQPLWNSVVGIGKLNYPRDVDVEEFFNIAMDGAKDAMRTKWKVGEGAQREKIARFFSERQDLLPDGIEPVKIETSGNYQHAFNVIGILRQLSAEDAGTGVTNTGTESDELEIQAQERQSAAAQLIGNRMADIYDALDDMGNEVVRRFMTATVQEEFQGYCDVMLFRYELEQAGIDEKTREMLAEQKYGEFLFLKVKTARALGDGSRMGELQTAQMFMASLGAFGPHGQELIKRRFALTLSRDVDWTNELVPIQELPNPDQLARARNENTAAVSRGIVGFVPQINPDDVNELHIPEHDQEIDAMLQRAEAAGGLDEPAFAGFKSLATHQAQHVQNLRGSEQNAEQANAWLQKLERQSTTAQGLYAAFQKNRQSEELSAADRIKFQQKDRDQELRERAQTSIEMDREQRIELDKRELATKEATAIAKAATDAAKVTLQPPGIPSTPEMP